MKKIFIKRIGAYLFDFIIVAIIISIITMKFTNSNKVIDELNNLIVGVNNENITMKEFSDKMTILNYDYQKSTVPLKIVNVLVNFGYFVIFATLNKGQTLGKKVFKIRVVNKDGKSPSIWNVLIRSLFLYGILLGIINIVSVNICNAKTFSYVNTIFDYVSYIFIIICFFMVSMRKDSKGLHDLMAGTNVIGEEK